MNTNKQYWVNQMRAILKAPVDGGLRECVEFFTVIGFIIAQILVWVIL